MTSERSKRRDFLSLIFISKLISKKLLIRNFFRYQIPCMNFFRPQREYLLGLIGVHDFFFI